MTTDESPQTYRARPESNLPPLPGSAVRHFTDCAMQPCTGTLANSQNAAYAAFHEDLHCLLRLKQPSGTEMHSLEISTCDPLKYKMGIPYLLNQDVWENPSEYKGLIFGECSFKSWRFV